MMDRAKLERVADTKSTYQAKRGSGAPCDKADSVGNKLREVAEWLKALPSKGVCVNSASRVRIPSSLPVF